MDKESESADCRKSGLSTNKDRTQRLLWGKAHVFLEAVITGKLLRPHHRQRERGPRAAAAEGGGRTEAASGGAITPSCYPLRVCYRRGETGRVLTGDTQLGRLVVGEAQRLPQAYSARMLVQPENGPRVPGATPPQPPSAAPLPGFRVYHPMALGAPGQKKPFLFAHSESTRGLRTQ